MNKLTHIPINISALLFFIASFVLSTHQATAQEIETDLPQLYELKLYQPIVDEKGFHSYTYIPVGQVSYADPELWANNEYYGFGFRFAELYAVAGAFVDYELGATNAVTSQIDGLNRRSDYEKFGVGVIFNQNQSGTSLFFGFGGGLINVSHSVKGEAAWGAPESDEVYDNQVIYQNYTPLLPFLLLNGVIPDSTGLYFHVEIGLKIKNRHILSFYFQPIHEGTLAARNNVYYNNASTEPNDNYYYGEIPEKIVESMAGFRYSYVFDNEEEEE
ncbi:MAG: hypothetical protein K0U39_01085 [Alphaproteobacteria bacterium]|nr:hypothetical protein [Alphaproteobacteria bacterium]